MAETDRCRGDLSTDGQGMIGQTLSHYRITDKLGRGGMGEVYLAEDTRLKRKVALKVISPDVSSEPQYLERFQSEAESLAALDHPNIVTIFSVEEAGGTPFLTMAYVEGQLLEELIPPEGFPLERFLELALPLADAVSAAHEHGVIHGDLKPGNVMVDGEGRLRILDFGLARLQEPERVAEVTHLTTQGTPPKGSFAGTLAYMSPEQIEGRPADHRSDMFSVGVLLYEMASGRRPFEAESAAGLVSAILRDAPANLSEVRPDLPSKLGRLLDRCLDKEPENRFDRSRELLEALRQVREQDGYGSVEIRSVAVLPFVDLSPAQDQGYFCDGLAEEILNALARVERLRVAARSSAFSFKGKDGDVRRVGRQIGVDTVVEGSLRKAGDRLRVTAQLVDVQSGYQLWSQRFDSELRDVFAIQDEISGGIVEALEVTLSPSEKRALGTRAQPEIEAFEYYLRGREYLGQTSKRGVELALQMFRRAVEVDPTYAAAFAGIADSHVFMHAWYGHDEADLEEADRMSRKAVQLAPDAAEAHASRGYALASSGRYEEAADEFEAAIERDPRLFEAYYHYGRVRFALGDYERTAELWKKASQVRLEDYQALLLLQQVYRSLGRRRDELDVGARGLARARRHLELNPDDARAYYLGATALLGQGRRAEGVQWIERALELQPDNHTALFSAACFYSVAGESDRALDLLEAAFGGTGYGLRPWLEKDSALDTIREHPRFARLLEGLKA